MAKKLTKTTTAKNAASPKARKSAVRNSPIPKKASGATGTAKQSAPAAVKRQVAITNDMIAQRAYEIWQSGAGGSELENWLRAERELKG